MLTETGRQSKMHCTLYINHHCWLHDAMHNVKPPGLCKHCKQFSAYDFDWLMIVSRDNWPMVQTFACSSLLPSDDLLLRSGKIHFSNPCNNMPMAVTSKVLLIFKNKSKFFSGFSIKQRSARPAYNFGTVLQYHWFYLLIAAMKLKMRLSTGVQFVGRM